MVQSQEVKSAVIADLLHAQPWWSFVVRGVFAIIFGLLIILWPVAGALAIVFLFGAYALVDGIFTLAALPMVKTGRGWPIFRGVCGILAGLVTFAWPGITALALFIIIATWAIVTGIFEIIIGAQSKAKNRWLLILGGVLSIILGWLLLVWPEVSVVALIWVIGLEAVLFGAVTIGLGVVVKKAKSAFAEAK